MLKITTDNAGEITVLKLEGKLSGEWVNELLDCWQQTLLSGKRRSIRVDLTGVSWVSDEGKALLVVMFRSGAELLAANLLMAGVVAEIGAKNGSISAV